MAKLPDIDWQAVIEAMAQSLTEHGLDPPFVLLINFFDQDNIMELDTFRSHSMLKVISNMDERYIGVIETSGGNALVATSYIRPRYELAMMPRKNFESLLEQQGVL